MPCTRQTSISRGRKMLAAGTTVIFFAASIACNNSPQAKEARFLRRGKDLVQEGESREPFWNSRMRRGPCRKMASRNTKGVSRIWRGDLTEGAANLRWATELNPKHQRAQLKIGELMAASWNREVEQRAASRLEEVLSASPNIEANEALAFAEWKMGKTDEAIGRLEETLRKFPARLPPRWNWRA